MEKLILVFSLWGCSTGAVVSVTNVFFEVQSNVYIVGKGQLYLSGLSRWVTKISNMFDIFWSLPVLSYPFQSCPYMKQSCLLSFQYCSFAVLSSMMQLKHMTKNSASDHNLVEKVPMYDIKY